MLYYSCMGDREAGTLFFWYELHSRTRLTNRSTRTVLLWMQPKASSTPATIVTIPSDYSRQCGRDLTSLKRRRTTVLRRSCNDFQINGQSDGRTQSTQPVTGPSHYSCDLPRPFSSRQIALTCVEFICFKWR